MNQASKLLVLSCFLGGGDLYAAEPTYAEPVIGRLDSSKPVVETRRSLKPKDAEALNKAILGKSYVKSKNEVFSTSSAAAKYNGCDVGTVKAACESHLPTKRCKCVLEWGVYPGSNCKESEELRTEIVDDEVNPDCTNFAGVLMAAGVPSEIARCPGCFQVPKNGVMLELTGREAVAYGDPDTLPEAKETTPNHSGGQ